MDGSAVAAAAAGGAAAAPPNAAAAANTGTPVVAATGGAAGGAATTNPAVVAAATPNATVAAGGAVPVPAVAPAVVAAAAANANAAAAPVAAAAAAAVPAEPEIKLDTEEGKRSHMMRLCERGDLKGVTDLLAKAPPTSLNYKETLKCECTDQTNFTFERSPLLWAIHQKNARLVALLIKHGADVNMKVDAEYPLHRAVWGVVCRSDQQMEIAKAILGAGADPNCISDQKGWTPLHYASCEPRFQGPIQVLLAAGADPHIPDYVQGYTPLERVLSFTREYDYMKESAQIWADRLVTTLRVYRKKLSVHLFTSVPGIAASLALVKDTSTGAPKVCDIIAAYVL